MQKLVGKTLVHYVSSGDKNKQVTLFLHGWGRSSDDWTKLRSILDDKYNCIAPDLPGFGSTIADMSKPWEVEDYSNLIVGFLKKIDKNPDYIIAHSLGGKIAVQIASNYELKKLILIAPSIAFKQSMFIKIKTMVFKMVSIPISILGIKNKLKIAYLFGSDDYKNAGELLPTFKRLVNRKMIKETGNVDANTLIIWGDRDNQLDVSSSKNIRSLIKKSKIRIVWGAGHDPHLDHKEIVIRILKEEGL